jgi:hypothetical protein
MTRREPLRRTVAAVGALLVACSIAGCSPAAGDRAGGVPSGSAAAPPTPFSGPWADLLTSTYGIATPEEREALEDGEIDELEYGYFRDRIIECLDGLGIEASFAADSTLEYTNGSGVPEDDINACMAEGGIQVLTMKDAIDRNPENLDEAAIMVECLREAGVIGPEYTARDYEDGVDLTTMGDDERFVDCSEDPLGLRNE